MSAFGFLDATQSAAPRSRANLCPGLAPATHRPRIFGNCVPAAGMPPDSHTAHKEFSHESDVFSRSKAHAISASNCQSTLRPESQAAMKAVKPLTWHYCLGGSEVFAAANNTV